MCLSQPAYKGYAGGKRPDHLSAIFFTAGAFGATVVGGAAPLAADRESPGVFAEEMKGGGQRARLLISEAAIQPIWRP